MAFDEGGVHYSYQHFNPNGLGQQDDRKKARDVFREFIKNFFVVDGDDDARNQKFVYRDALRQRSDQLEVDLQHIKTHDPDVGNQLEENPTEYLPLLEHAALDVVGQEAKATAAAAGEEDAPPPQGVQVMLKSSHPFGPASIRELTSKSMSRLVMIPGIITAATKPKHKATHITLQCTTCNHTTTVACTAGLGSALIPRQCGSSPGQAADGGVQDCGIDPYTILPHRSAYVDQQTLKLQERPEDVPTGELPRSLLLVADRKLCGTVTPGSRVTVVGIYSAHKATKVEKGGVPLQQPYVRVVGLHRQDGDSRHLYTFTPQEEQEFREYAKQPRVHDAIRARIAPHIFGHSAIKLALACLLFGGSRKKMPDGTWRRGDINVLMLGDPSTAKSQFLKFASKVAPIAVYTSGKGSSAAGLTATVVQDASTREFYLEGGAMVLADNGVCCIDEFDKMRPEDRVAIHEAMEQQTISIAKAGITTMLKSRTSVLAAANPPSGRYDDLQSAADNIDLQSTILSRFDLIFIVKDNLTRDADLDIARRIMEVHREAGGRGEAGRAGAPSEKQAAEAAANDFLKRYIHFARTRCFPRLTEAAGARLQNTYVKMREEARKVAQEAQSDTPPVPMTVRQLEALVRLSEALARMQLSAVAAEEHVEAALELFNTATMQALKSGLTQHVVVAPAQLAEVHRIEEKVKRVLAIRQTRSERQVVEQLVGWGEAEGAVRRALAWLVQQGDLQYRSERRLVQRLK